MTGPQLPAELRKGDYEALADFRYQIRRYLRFSETISHQHGITVLQYLLLLQLKGYPGREWATIAELAERLQAHHHGVVTLVTRCEEVGLVERRKGEGDRRVVQVVLLPKGEELLARLALLHREQLLHLGDELAVPSAAVFMQDDKA
ncbi:MarR family transcriptional regulator [Massilia cavernae]|uniref:MarR family transcriptional regulator n=1 Tax=Massilia cavernae TaxID=2320864 RepID=A0A418XR01_9BURK|nr:MarR family transcriptional regulator [Massilia cavernae]RJG14885.1 MarR family transcriptional regulator [Massilia cavernae]